MFLVRITKSVRIPILVIIGCHFKTKNKNYFLHITFGLGEKNLFFYYFFYFKRLVRFGRNSVTNTQIYRRYGKWSSEKHYFALLVQLFFMYFINLSVKYVETVIKFDTTERRIKNTQLVKK